MAMYREGEYAAGATTRKGNLKQAKKVVNKALAKSAAQKKAASKKAAQKKAAASATAGRGFNPTMPSKPKGYKAPGKKISRQS